MKNSTNVCNRSGLDAALPVAGRANAREAEPRAFIQKIGLLSWLRRTLTASCVIGVLASMLGCSSSTSTKPLVGPIYFTDANGNIQNTTSTSAIVNTGIYFDVIVQNDRSNLGADWTVACGSAPPPGTPLPPGSTEDASCGTFTPAHTLSGPVPGYASSGSGYVALYTPPASPPKGGIVTLFAASTADPSRYASLTLTILGLPISIGFAPAPPSSLAVNAMTSLKAVVSNDYVAGGVNWTVTCASKACGSLSSAQTVSGVATTYTAPATVPAGRDVTVTATSVTDSTKSLSASISISALAVSVLPAALSVATGGTGLLNATVTNDTSRAGVDWSLTCASQGACGSITPHTVSGAAATYTAPAAVPSGNTVVATATSTADKTTSGTSTVTITTAQTPSVRGSVRGGLVPVIGAAVSLYAVGDSGYGSASLLLNKPSSTVTDGNGEFNATGDIPCPSPGGLLYLVVNGGSAGAGVNPNLALMTMLGRCDQLSAETGVVINEVTTVASAYAMAGFMTDAAHLGSTQANYAGLANAFATENDLVDVSTGEARALTPTGSATVPREKINTLANVLHRCVGSPGGNRGDGTPCGDLFLRLNGSPAGDDTVRASLAIAANAAGSTTVLSATDLFDLAGPNGPFQPSLANPLDDWMLPLEFTPGVIEAGPGSFTSAGLISAKATAVDGVGRTWRVDAASGLAKPSPGAADASSDSVEDVNTYALAIDPSGNVWLLDHLKNAVTEFVGAATPTGPAIKARSAGMAESVRATSP